MIWLLLFAFVLTGCASNFTYTRPAGFQRLETSKILEKPRDAVWDAAVPALGKQFFVINNMDKSSGFINLSYGGDPEAYVDCGRIVSYVKNARGERIYDFPAARASQNYERFIQGIYLFAIQRQMTLDGRMNLIFEDLGANSTRVSANTRYVVTRTVSARDPNGLVQNTTHSISFNSGSSGFFPMNQDGSVECVSTGKLENDVLSLFK